MNRSPSDSLPNIVFIMADDMGYGDLGCYGAAKIPTPNMDRVAREGVRFTDAHSASAVCTPSRYGVITGRYCWRSSLKSGVLGGYGAPLIEPGRMTVASLLKKAGYATAAVGKWHIGLGWQPKDRAVDADSWDDTGTVDFRKPILGGPTALGFDTFFGIAGSLDMPPYCFIENDRTVGIPDREKEHYYNQQRKGPQAAGWRDERVDITFAEKSAAFIEDHARSAPERPFFLYLTPASPHRPCDCRPDFVTGKSRAGDRGDMVVLFDWVVGQVLDALDRAGVADDTLVMVTSDNGARLTCADGETYGHKSCGDWRGQKADIWDGGHREPFVARWPGRIRPGSVSDEMICLTDLMATCAAIVGSPLPADAGEDSVNVLPALLGQKPAAPLRQAVVHHSVSGMFSVRRGPWKCVFGLGSGGFSEPRRVERGRDDPPGQLYHMEKDPAETTNVWEEHPEVVEELTALLDKYRSTGKSRDN